MDGALIAILIGFGMDLLIGDPHQLPHPVIFIGKLIDCTERWCRKCFPKTESGERMAGAMIWLIVVTVSTGIPALILMLCQGINFYLRVAVEGVMCWQILAVKSLKDETMKVHEALEHGTLEDARYAVSMIVGRDTKWLDERGVARAAVETVAENTADGIVAPLFFLIIGGAPFGFLYKAVNTMDSMLGYVEEPYKNVGFVPAKADDIFNYIPARLSAIFMLAAGGLLGMDLKNGWKIFKRDRYCHASPNSAQTESVCAGLMGLRLAGDAWYHGVLHRKKYIGDPIREIENEDIPRVCRLSYVTAVLALIVGAGLRFILF